MYLIPLESTWHARPQPGPVMKLRRHMFLLQKIYRVQVGGTLCYSQLLLCWRVLGHHTLGSTYVALSRHFYLLLVPSSTHSSNILVSYNSVDSSKEEEKEEISIAAKLRWKLRR